MLFKKIMLGDINADNTVSFASSNFPYNTQELSLFINDVRASVPSKFGFDEYDESSDYVEDMDNDGSFDGILFVPSMLIFCTCYGKSSAKFYINIEDEEYRTLIISDLYTMNSILNEFALSLHTKYEDVYNFDEKEVEEPDDGMRTDKVKSKGDETCAPISESATEI
jgi:hypothetical protein